MAAAGSDGRPGARLLGEPGDLDLEAFAAEIERARSALPSRVNADPQEVERGLARLVLTVIELLRRLLEQQAIRRIEAGSLADEQIERMGQTFLKLEAKMSELRQTFGLEAEDLNLDLGPLGRLM